MSPEILAIVSALIVFGLIAIIGVTFAENGGVSTKRVNEIAGKKTVSLKEKAIERSSHAQTVIDKMRASEEDENGELPFFGDIDQKIRAAGLDIPSSLFFMICAGIGVVVAFAALMVGFQGPPELFGINLQNGLIWPLLVGVGAGAAVPNWFLGFRAKGRLKKMLNQFADGIDIIVRGVKSGLPLNECIRIIAAESQPPIGPEFDKLATNLKMGMPLERAMSALHTNVPLSEVNFFGIVLIIQQKAGGNLAEALGNLSTVIRSRKMMREKIKAMSSEAKASAMIIGVLPFAVTLLVYLTTPDYIMELFRHPTGHSILFMGACLYGIGITVMRRMINFDI